MKTASKRALALILTIMLFVGTLPTNAYGYIYQATTTVDPSKKVVRLANNDEYFDLDYVVDAGGKVKEYFFFVYGLSKDDIEDQYGKTENDYFKLSFTEYTGSWKVGGTNVKLIQVKITPKAASDGYIKVTLENSALSQTGGYGADSSLDTRNVYIKISKRTEGSASTNKITFVNGYYSSSTQDSKKYGEYSYDSNKPYTMPTEKNLIDAGCFDSQNYMLVGFSPTKDLATISKSSNLKDITLYLPGEDYYLQGDITLYPIYVPKNGANAQYYIRYDGILPGEPGSFGGVYYPNDSDVDDGNTSKWLIRKVLPVYYFIGGDDVTKTGFATSVSLEEFVDFYMDRSTLYQNTIDKINISDALTGEVHNLGEIYRGEDPERTLDDYEVVWYVVKKQAKGWHVDGLVKLKNAVVLRYHENAPEGTVKNMPAVATVYAPGKEGIHIGWIYKNGWSQATTPTRNGYTFLGWNTEADGSGEWVKTWETSADDFTMPNHDVDLYAQWAKPFTWISVNKVWNDVKDPHETYKRRPTEITVKLQRRLAGDTNWTDFYKNGSPVQAKLNKSNSWSWTYNFDSSDLAYNGKLYEYRAVEINNNGLSTYYDVTYGSVDNKKTIKNTRKSFNVTYLVDGKTVDGPTPYWVDETVTVAKTYDKITKGYTVTDWSIKSGLTSDKIDKQGKFDMPLNDVVFVATTAKGKYSYEITHIDWTDKTTVIHVPDIGTEEYEKELTVADYKKTIEGYDYYQVSQNKLKVNYITPNKATVYYIMPTITKHVDSASVIPKLGETVTFEIEVKNNGNVPSNAVITEEEGNTIVSGTGYVVSNGGRTATISNLAGGNTVKVKVTHQVTTLDVEAGAYQNDATVKYNGKSYDVDATTSVSKTLEYHVQYYYDGVQDTSATDTFEAKLDDIISTYTEKAKTYVYDKKENVPLTITTNVASNEIRVYYVSATISSDVEKSADKTHDLELGNKVVYTVIVTNNSNTRFWVDKIVDTRVSGLKTADFVPAVIEPNKSASITYEYTVTQDDVDNGFVLNEVNVTVKNKNGQTTDDDDDNTVYTKTYDPSILVEKTANPNTEVKVGQTVTYEVKVTNDGNVTVYLTQVTDSMYPTKVNVDSFASKTLAPGAYTTATYTYVVTQADVDDQRTIENVVTVTAQNKTGKTTEGTDTENVEPEENKPKIHVTKTAAPTVDVKAGETVEYTVII